MRVAIFDFDGTLYKQETFQLMMDFFKKHPQYNKYYRPFYRAILPRFLAYKMKLYPEPRMKERSMEIYINALRQLSKTEINTFFHDMAQQMQDDFNELVVKKLQEHRKNNVYTMLVSGAFVPLLEAVTQSFHFDQIIGTEVPFHKNAFDETTPIFHIQGQRKTDKILQALKNHTIDWDNSYAYGDSYSDLPVLQLVGHPIAVDPDDQLRTHAKRHGWQIL